MVTLQIENNLKSLYTVSLTSLSDYAQTEDKFGWNEEVGSRSLSHEGTYDGLNVCILPTFIIEILSLELLTNGVRDFRRKFFIWQTPLISDTDTLTKNNTRIYTFSFFQPCEKTTGWVSMKEEKYIHLTLGLQCLRVLDPSTSRTDRNMSLIWGVDLISWPQ